MKAIAPRPLASAFLLGLPLLAGCGSMRSVDPAQYASMNCAELNVALGELATGVTSTAISRANISNTRIPFWLPGGQKAVSVLKDRRTADIERLQAQEAAIEASRRQRCPREL
ncbi:MAG: hypothetical protein IKE42_03125 [Aquamicrobium sp.]|nr:hypothetical protein [Aquamicrobium sp.]QAZ46607.1 hypothetical protein C1M53_30480 [Mesorhizobium sp. Pch-S]